MKSKLFALLLTLFLGGCSTVRGMVQDDLASTYALSEKYGKPDVKECVVFLTNSLNVQVMRSQRLEELLMETTDGVLSAALKAALVAEIVREMAGALDEKHFEEQFDEHCSKVAGKLFLHLLRDARELAKRVGSRGF